MTTKVLTETERPNRSAATTEAAMNAQHDQLAHVLQDISERFPEDGFTKHGRLRGLLADHLPNAEREIRVALDAIDEGVIDMYRDSTSEELGMRIDRLVMRLENSRGIREDIGRPVVLAYGYALGVGELPSQTLTVARKPEEIATQVNDPGDDWIGATVIAQDVAPDRAQAEPKVQPEAPAPSSSRNAMIALAVAAVLGLAYMGGQPEPPPQQTSSPGATEPASPAAGRDNPQQKPSAEPAQETRQEPRQRTGQNTEEVTEVAEPMPAPAPVKRKVAPKPQPARAVPGQPANSGALASGIAYWYDPYGVVWELEFNGAEFQGIGRQNNVPVASMIGMRDPANNLLQYELYNALDVPLGVGEGTLTDPTHIQFTTYDGFGSIIGQGTFHINHPPNG